MREFVVLAHAAPTDPGFSLDDLAGAGRMDLLCRAVSAAVFTSHGIRSAVRVHLVVQDAVTITVDSDSLRNARPDERSIAGLLNAGLAAAADAIGHQPADAAPGVTVRTRGLELTLAAIEAPVYALHEDGTPVDEVEVPADVAFVLSDHVEFSEDEQATVAAVADETVCLSPKVVHTDHAVTLSHHWLDTDGYTRF
ncbi:MAG: tRNA (pseudouridine(54)-N(1))-methyltransferase TrmY [Halobacteriaceae archaeon]